MNKILLSLATIAFCGASLLPAQTTFNLTGGVQTYTVPAGITEITYTIAGAAGANGATGGNNSAGGNGGLGAVATGTLTVTPGEVLNLFVGGQGQGAVGGYNGGGAGGNQLAGGGGGASDIRRNGLALTDRILTAGGGGGGGRGGCDPAVAFGGNGGNADANGSNGGDAPTSGGVAGGGFGGVAATGGAAGIGCSGFLGAVGAAGSSGQGGNGGNGQTCCCFGSPSIPGGGGGGGGFIGGAGGGGGSAGTTGCSGNDKGGGGGGAGGTTDATGAFIDYTNTGNGYIIICPTPNIAQATISGQCIGSTQILSVTGNLGTSADWEWFTAAGTPVGTGSSVNITIPNVPTDYVVRPTLGCHATIVEATVSVDPNPIFGLVNSNPQGCGATTITPQTNVPNTYAWSTGEQGSSITINTPGTYNVVVTATSPFGCTATQSTSVAVFALPTVSVTNNGTGVLTATSGFVSYQWLDASGNIIPNAASAQYTSPQVGGTFTVRVTDANGCSNTSAATVVVTVDEVAKSIFTVFPNPTKDIINVQGANVKMLQVFALDGKLVATYTNTNRIDISKLPAGIYNLNISTENKTESIQIVKE